MRIFATASFVIFLSSLAWPQQPAAQNGPAPDLTKAMYKSAKEVSAAVAASAAKQGTNRIPIIFAVVADAVDDLKPFPPFGNHIAKDFGRVLQVDVERDYRLAARMIEPSGQGRLLPEIARERNSANPRVRFVSPANFGHR